MLPDRFGQLCADGEQWVERGQRILEDCADLAAADLLHLAVAQIVDAAIRQPDLAFGDVSRAFEQSLDGQAGHRLAGTGFSDDAEDFAGAD